MSELTGAADAGGISERLTAALTATWRAIQDRHPDVPAVVVTLGSGTLVQRGALRLGHFAQNRWHRGEQTGTATDAELHELFIGGEGLRAGPEKVLATLLHQAAHALAAARGIRDTANRGYYHNKRYQALAEELGLIVTEAGPRGWHHTRLSPATTAAYADQLAQLATALTVYRHAETTPPPAARSRNKIPATCACPRRIWAAPGTLTQAPILCGHCGQPFRPVEEPSQSQASSSPSSSGSSTIP